LKQTLTTILAVFISGFILSSFQIYRDLKKSRINEENNIARMLKITEPSAAQALYHLDRKQAEEIVNGYITYEPIIYVSLTDNFGGILYEKYSPRFKNNSPFFKLFYPDTEIYNSKLSYSPGNSKAVFVGTIKLQTDYLFIYNNFIKKTKFILTSNLLLYLCLAVIFTIIFKKNITSPLLNLSEKISKIDPKKDQISTVDIPIMHRYDEIGSIIQNINLILNEYYILKTKLEEKVYERTITLEKNNNKLKKSMAQLKQASEQLIESEKMASIGRLVAGISHEINTPMGNCLLVASSMDKKLDKSINQLESNQLEEQNFKYIINESKTSMKIILKNLDQSLSLVKSLKKIAVDQGYSEPKLFILTDLLNDLITSIRPQLKGKNISIKLNIKKDLHIFQDPGIFSQIFNNLLINSIIHGFENINAGEIKISISATSNKAIILYQDSGRGIPKDIVSKIFEPFITTKRHKGGSGLGLHIVYNLVTTKLKGKIKYMENPTNRGTMFSINFPYNNQR